MKHLTAVIHPDRLDEVRDALAHAEGAAMTISRVGLAAASQACPGAPLVYEYGEKVQLEITVAEPYLAAAIDAILLATRDAGVRHGPPGPEGRSH